MTEIIKAIDGNKIYLSEEMVQQIKVLIRGKTYLANKEELASLSKGEVNEGTFARIYSSIIRSFQMILDNPYVSIDDSFQFDESLLNELKDLKEEYNKAKAQLQLNDDCYMLVDDYPRLEHVIDLIYQCTELEKKMYLIRDLTNAKRDYIIDMKYFMSEDSIKKFEREYSEALQEKNIDKMLQMLKQVQQLILQEWEKYDGDMERMTDDNFCFIGHSTGSSQFNGDFFSRYVSCSLFNQNLNDTYRRRYGFIMAPKNIIGASSNDMFVNNYANDIEDTLLYTSVPIIHHPQRLLDECIELKRKNIDEDEEKEVYNEVFIDGFSPIGIFCFTNGAKELDDNYRLAIGLQKSFPNLKIKFIDIMKLKKGNELKQMQLELLKSLEKNSGYNIGLDVLPRYEIFFQKFDELKKKGNYTKEDIENIYQYNNELLLTSPDILFDGQTSEEEIKFVLGRSYTFNIDEILKGNITIYALENLKSLIEYKDRLNKYYAGLSEFVLLMSRVPIDEEIINEIKSDLPTNFYKMAKVLAKRLKFILEQKKYITQTKIDSLKERHHILMEEYNKRKEIQEKYQFYFDILSNEYRYSLLQMDIDSLESDQEQNKQEKNDLIVQKEEIEEKINKLIADNNSLPKENYKDSIRYKNIVEEIKMLKVRLIVLQRHSILNMRKIKAIKDKINSLEREAESMEIEYDRNHDDNILENNLIIDSLKEELSDIIARIEERETEEKSYKEEKDNINKKIFELFKCHTIEEALIKIQEAKSFMSNYDHSNGYLLREVERELQEINEQILSHEKTLTEIEEEKGKLSK